MTKVQKFRIVALALCVVAVFFIWSNFKSDKADSTSDQSFLQSKTTVSSSAESDYKAYMETYQEQILQSESNGNAQEVNISGADYSDSNMEDLSVDGSSVITGENGTVTYQFNVPVSGAYNIEVKYYPVEGKGGSIIRTMFVNGEIPFEEANSLNFERIWVDQNKDYLLKTDTNQAFPAQIEKPDWIVKKLESSDGYYNEPFKFYFEAGENELTLQSIQEPMQIEYIKLTPVKELKTYEEYKNDYTAKGASVISQDKIENGAVTVQAEDAYQKTTASLLPVNDRTSVKTIPYHSSNIILNTIGGDNWSNPGEKITWQIDVPEAGLYKIAVRFKQVANRDFYSIRKLTINGEVPFTEAAQLMFNYKSKFQISYLGNKDEDYYFYFNKGMNQISMAVALGKLGDSINEVQKSVSNLNTLYLKIIEITGTDPDQYRDYQLSSLIPDMVEKLQLEYDRLSAVSEAFSESEKQKITEITTVKNQLAKLIQDPSKIASELATFNTNLSSLSNWTLNLGKQPLLLDYISVCGDDYQLPKAEGNFLQNMKHGFMAFVGSFTNDYTASSEKTNKDRKTLEVWIATSRDQYNIVQRMVNEAFSQSDYDVVLKMVGADTIMPATLTGNGPDVAIQINSILPTNFAFRNAAYDLTQFEDFEEVSKEFPEATMEYFEYNGGYYALPDQMSFPVMFYRTDVFKELNLEVPNTWDEFLNLIPYLQSNNMDVCLETYSAASLGASTSMSSTKAINSIFLSMLYQNGAELYKDGGTKSNLDSDEALQVFEKWTEYYTKYNFQVAVDFLTRFRTGSVPLGIVDFTYYNTLKATAPEISGNWAIAPIPGTVQKDGTIDRSVASIVGASMIIKTTVDKKQTQNEAWEFLKWWTGSDAQVKYAKELEAVLGPAARYPVANIDAVSKLAWSAEDLAVLKETIASLRGIPQVPGGYITGRYIENAFLNVINNYLNPVDTLYSMVEYVNQELYYKHKEFGITNTK